MVRKIEKQDYEIFCTLIDEFYHSSAVSHPIDPAHYSLAFEQMIQDSPYINGFLIFHEGETAGFAEMALTFSTEAGGLVVWLEDLYIRPQFQGKGLGKEFFTFMDTFYKGRAVRFRLEVDHGNEGAIRLYKSLGFDQMPYMPMYRELKDHK